jgi:hypothetical protein
MRITIILATALAVVLFSSADHADESTGKHTVKSFVVKALPIRENGATYDIQMEDASVNIMGDPDSEQFGLSFKGTLIPKDTASGPEKVVAGLYINCQDQPPGKTSGILVGTVEIGELEEGGERPAFLVTAPAKAFAPLREIQCARIRLENHAANQPTAGSPEPEAEPEASSYVVKNFTIPDKAAPPNFQIGNTTVNLIGKPDSESFGLSYRGDLAPQVDIKGGEKLVAYLYLKCDDQSPEKTNGVNVASVNVTDIKQGRKKSAVIETVEVKSFVPLRDVECVKLGVRGSGGTSSP